MQAGTESQIKEVTQKLVLAYSRVFEKGSPFAQDVLDDLIKFCRGNESTFHPDPRVHAALEGRREVLLRILDHIHLNHEELYAYHVARINNSKRGSR